MSASWHGEEGAVRRTAREVGGKCAVCVCVWVFSGGGSWRVLIFSAVEVKGPVNKHDPERESFCLRQLDVI